MASIAFHGVSPNDFMFGETCSVSNAEAARASTNDKQLSLAQYMYFWYKHSYYLEGDTYRI